jgi:hypothetical protein
MTLEEVYSVLENKIYYEKESLRKFSFVDNSIHIDRRAFIPFSIYKEDESFFLDPDVAIANEKELRIEIERKSVNSIDFYGKTSGEKLLTLSEEIS